MIRLEIYTDLSSLNIAAAFKCEADFFLEYDQYAVHFAPKVIKNYEISEVFQTPYEKGYQCMLKLRLNLYHPGAEHEPITYTTRKFTLDQESFDDFFDENLAVKITMHLQLDKTMMTIPNMLVILDTGYIKGLRAVVQAGDISVETDLEPFEQNVSAIAHSIVVPDTREVLVAVRLAFGALYADLFAVRVYFQPATGYTIAITAQLQDFQDLFKLKAFIDQGKQDAYLHALCQYPAVRGLGMVIPEQFGAEHAFSREQMQSTMKTALKRIRAQKQQIVPQKLMLRLFLNYTQPLNYYYINKFNAFGKSFQRPDPPFLIFNFSACDALRNSWILLTRDDGKISSHVSSAACQSQPLKISYIDCENCVCYFRADKQLCPSIPQLLRLFSEYVALEQRLKRILDTYLTIVVVINEKQFFKLPISLSAYEDSIIGSITQGSQYKIQLEVRYTGIVITFTFNFQVVDPDLQQYLKYQRAPPLKELPAVPKSQALPPAPATLDATRYGAKTAQPEPHRRVRVKKIIRKIAKDDNAAPDNEVKSYTEDLSDENCDHIGNDSLELDYEDNFNDAVKPLKKKKKIIKKKKVDSGAQLATPQFALAEQSSLNEHPRMVDDFALPELSLRKIKK